MRCKFWDCGWCSAPDNVNSNDDNGACNNPTGCPYNLGDDNARLSKLCIEQQSELNKLRSQLKRMVEIGRE